MVRITGPVLVGAVAPVDFSGAGRTSTVTAGVSTLASTFAVMGVRNVIVGMCCAPTHTAPAARPHTVAHAAIRPQTRQGLGVGVHVGSPNVSSGAQISIIPRKRRSAPIREARLVRGARRNSKKSAMDRCESSVVSDHSIFTKTGHRRRCEHAVRQIE